MEEDETDVPAPRVRLIAAHDFGGHRVEAMELIQGTQKELNETLAFER